MQTLPDINKKFLDIKSELTKSTLTCKISECLDQHYICFSYKDVLNESYSKFDPISKDKKGIYLFEGKYKTNSEEKWREFNDNWKLIKFTPDIVAARFKSYDFSADTYLPLYVGKAAHCLRTRVVQHVFAQKKNGKGFFASTSALRLLQHIQLAEAGIGVIIEN